MIMDKTYIFHHGILGQKWGHTNGPPYPLDYDDHSVLEKRKNLRTELDNYVRDPMGKAKELVKAHPKEVLIGGAAITAAILVKAEGHVKKRYINDITPYWKDKLDQNTFTGRRYVRRMEKDLKRMKLSDLVNEAKFVKKNEWSRLSYDGKHWR